MSTFFVDIDTETTRYNLCLLCEKFIDSLKLCGVCKCFMPGKVKIGFSSCPLNKWHEIKEESKIQ